MKKAKIKDKLTRAARGVLSVMLAATLMMPTGGIAWADEGAQDVQTRQMAQELQEASAVQDASAAQDVPAETAEAVEAAEEETAEAGEDATVVSDTETVAADVEEAALVEPFQAALLSEDKEAAGEQASQEASKMWFDQPSSDATTWADDVLVETAAGLITMGEVREYARIRDEREANLIATIGKGESNASTTNASDDATGTYSALSGDRNSSYSFYQSYSDGGIYIDYANSSITDNRFRVFFMDNWYEGYCLDTGLPAPAQATYSFWADYDAETGTFEITLDCADAEPYPGQINTGARCQQVGDFHLAFDGSLYIQKTSTNTSITDNNACYSYENTVFGVYWNYNDFLADEGLEGTEGNHADYILTTDATGKTPTIDGLAIGEWYVRELSAPQGFEKKDKGWAADVKATAAVGVTVSTCEDNPIDDPDGIQLRKMNAKGEEVTLTGDATLEGAQYAFDYYDGYYNTVEEAQASGSPMRHWVLKTDEDGYTSLSAITKTDHSLVDEDNSDEFFYDVDGYATMPLGTLVIYELKAPTGYLKSNDSFIACYVQDDNEPSGGRWEGGSTGEGSSVDYNQGDNTVTAKEQQAFYHLEVFKTIQGVENEVSPEGIQFEVVYVGSNTQEYGKTYATLTIDATGHASTKDVFAEDEGLPVGTYEVREVESTLPKDKNGNYLIQPYSLTSTDEGTNVVATVTFPGNYEPLDVARVDCVDYTTTPPSLEKKDIDTGEPISDVEFTLYKYTGKLGMNDGAIATDPATLSAKGEYWEEVEAVKTNEHGLATFSNQPYGIYMMVETEANYKYLNASETAKELSSADPLDTARIFKVDKNTPATLQTWEDELIQIETTVDKSTIDVTSVGLVSKSKSDGGDDLTNVGKETYSYDVAFSSGNTNTYADEFWMVDELNMTASPYDLRVTKIYMPTVINDTAPTAHLLIRTNKSSDDAWDATSVVAKEKESYHPFSLTDGTSRFDGTGWRYVGEFSSIESSCIEVFALGLDTDEYLTGICLYYGAVEQGFITVDPLSYDVTSTHELSVGTVIPNTATSHITRNWANREGSDGGLTDDDEDSVTTTVITTFEMSYLYELLNGSTGHIGSLLAQTGDSVFSIALVLMALIALSGAGVVVVRRKQKKGDGVNAR